MEKIKIGIIGYGSWVKKAYIPSLKHDGRAEVVAISARSETTMRLIKEDFGDSIYFCKGSSKFISSFKTISANIIPIKVFEIEPISKTEYSLTASLLFKDLTPKL